MVRKQIIGAVLFASFAVTTAAYAADDEVKSSTTVGGVMWFDFSYINLKNENAEGTAIETPPSGVGLDVKRFYFIVDHRFDDVWGANLTTDAQYSSSSGGVAAVYIKKLYVEGKFNPGFVLHVGAYDTPWVPFEEKLYGYRWLEKIPIDRLGFGTSADWGINATGSFGEKRFFTYSASILNGGGYRNPTRTKDVDFEGRVSLNPIDWLTLGAGFYTGHLGKIDATTKDFPQNTASRWNVIAVVEVVGLKVGIEFFQAKNYKTVNNPAEAAFGSSSIVNSDGTPPTSDKAQGGMVFASYEITNRWSIFSRYDNAKSSKDVAPNLKDEYFNVGVDFNPVKPLDVALVYKYEKVSNGSTSIGGVGNAGAGYTIGGDTAQTSGTFNEGGIYVSFRF